MTHAESSPQAAPENVENIPEIPYGTRLKLQKIDPKTFVDIPQRAPLNGSLWKFGDTPAKYGISVGHKVWMDSSGDHAPDHTSVVQRIERMPDGSYRIHTLSSVYRVILLADSKREDVPQKTVTAPVRRSVRNLFGFLK